jgi:DNA-binding GntR family transcriptional regulator
MAANLEQLAYRRLRQDLLHGRIRLGQVVSENAIAKRIGISRTPVRHAMRQLTNEGVFVPLSHVGAVVKVPTAREVEESFALRQLLECQAAGLAAARVTPELALELRLAVREYRRACVVACRADPGSSEEMFVPVVRADLHIHGLVLRIANDRQLARAINLTHLQTRTRISDSQDGIAWPEVRQKLMRICREHASIADAIAASDEKAARLAMARHIEGAKITFLKLLQVVSQSGQLSPLSPAVQWMLNQQEDDVFAHFSDDYDESDRDASATTAATSGHRAISPISSSHRPPGHKER